MKPFDVEAALEGAVLNNTVTEADLQGEIADFPLHVVQAMCDEQVRQGNPFSPSVFRARKRADRPKGGFTWAYSKRGHDFWYELISSRDFDHTPSPNNPTQGTNNMKHFDLVAALEGAPVVLRNGCKAYVLADTARLNNFESIYRDEYTLVVIVAGGGLNMHMRDGSYDEKPDNPKDIIGMWSDPPKTIRIGEYDVPEPVREPLENGTTCWYPKLSNIGLIDGYIWCNDDTDVRLLSYGLIHLTEEAAKAHAEALLSLTKAAD